MAGQAIGSAPASGNELSAEAEIVYTDRLRNHSYTLESEHIISNFSKSRTFLPGGYVQGQYSAFDTRRWGDLDPFIRYDWVYLSTPAISRAIAQQAIRVGVNWNLPESHKLLNFHLEYSRNLIAGPILAIPLGPPNNELGLELRFNVIRYIRH